MPLISLAAGKRLRSIILRVERLNEEIEGLQSDRRDLFAEGKAAGFEPRIMREIVKRRKMDPDEVQTLDDLLDTYESQMKMGHNSDDDDDL